MRIIGQLCQVVASIAVAVCVLGSPIVVSAQVGSWTAKTSMPTARLQHSLGVVGSIVYVVGGNENGNVTATVQAYSSAADVWTPKASMSAPRELLGIGVVNGILYAVGGQSTSAVVGTLEAYDPATNTWNIKASMPTPRTRIAVATVDGVLYAIGGCTDTACGGFVGTVEAYDPVSDMWTTRASMPTARRDLTAQPVNGLIYVAGGSFGPGCSVTNVLEAFDPVSNTWASKAPMPTARNNLASGAIDGILYAVGGTNCVIGDFSMQTAEAYNPAMNTWSAVAAMPTGRGTLAAGVVAQSLHAIGGSGPDNVARANEAFSRELTVLIDIKPGSHPNSINLGSSGVVPVAIFSTPSFDATQVDPESVTLAGAAVRLIGRGSKFACGNEDVNGDGRLDVVCHVETAQFMIEEGATTAVLTGTTFAGQQIRGEDSIRVVK